MNAMQTNIDTEFIVEKEDMENMLITRNQRHLHQAHQSKVGQSGCVQILKSEKTEEQILRGEFYTDRDEGFNQLVQGLQQRIPECTNVISKEVIKAV